MNTTNRRVDLNGQWTLLDDSGNAYQATVPGCVHTDIIKEDMFWRDNSLNCRWIENHNWRYCREFELSCVEKDVELVFEGLDTYCDVFLNGKNLGHCENMFVPHRFCVGDYLKKGDNLLEVQFYSPVMCVKDRKLRPAAFTCERLNTRRIQCTYGWDWVDRFVTCGICRPVYLECCGQFGVEDLYVYTHQIDMYGAEVRVTGTYKNYEAGTVVAWEVISPTGEIIWNREIYVNTKVFSESVTIPNPQLWYPSGYGKQPLYKLRLHYGDCEYETGFGIRTVRIMENIDTGESDFFRLCKQIKQTPSANEYDKNESFKGFILLVNGVKILCMGANYVPVEPFVSAETRTKITDTLEKAKSCGMNMIRVWGGGVFEQPHFYDECDRLGLMVIQDFLMACGEYPEDEPWFLEQLALEAAYAAKHLRNHPCLMWWHGDNENAVNGCDLDKNYPGRLAAYQAILPVLNQLDYTRRLLPSSPYGGIQYASKTVGTTHNTQYLSYIFDYIENQDMADYKEYFSTFAARFISEEPSCGALSKPSLLHMMTEEDIYEDEMTMWQHHTKSNPAASNLLSIGLLYARKVFGEFTDSEDRFFKLKYLQCEQVRISIENCRKHNWFCGGIIYWMLNDCWPAAFGWAFIDYYGIPKPAYYSFKRASKQVISSVDPMGIIISNRGQEERELLLKYRMIDYHTGKETILLERRIKTVANEQMDIKYPISLPIDSILVCDLYDGNLYDRSFYKDGPLYIEPSAVVTVTQLSTTTFSVSSLEYVQAVELETDAVLDDNWFSLTAGEQRIITANKPIEKMAVNAYRLKSEKSVAR